MSQRRIGVLGTLVWDTIRHPHGSADEPVEQWGGVAYSLSAFAAVCPPGWSIFPIIRVGEDLAESAIRFLDDLGLPSTGAGVQIVAEPNNRVELRYSDQSERAEILTGRVSPWPAADLLPLLDGLDALYVNFLSGFEMELETARQVRQATDILLYIDLHSLFLSDPGQGARVPRLLPDAREWLWCGDFIQVNDEEFRLLLEGTQGSLWEAPLPLGPPPVLLVTRGDRGASFRVPAHQAALLNDRESQLSALSRSDILGDVPLVAQPVSGDPTGCGDVWGAAVFSSLLDGADLRAAMARGHRAARAKLGQERIEGIKGAIASALSPG